MSFSENLMRLRKQKGLSQEEFANEINVTRQTVSKWELGVSTPDMDKLVQMASFFGITVDDLVNSEEATSKVNNKNYEENIQPINNNDGNNAQQPNNHDYKNKHSISVKLYIVTIIILIIVIIAVLFFITVKDLKNKGNNNSSTNGNNINNMENMVENVSNENQSTNANNSNDKQTIDDDNFFDDFFE